MKKVLLFAICAMAVAATVALVSCKKEDQNISGNAQNQSAKTFDPSHITDMNAYLASFKEKMKAAEKGEGESLSSEEARWHLEAVLNYSHGDAGYQTSAIQCDTIWFKIRSNGDIVNLSQLNNAFDNISMGVEQSLKNCSLKDKSVLAIRVDFNDQSKDEDILVQAVLSIRGVIPNAIQSFGDDDYWYASIYRGKCGEYQGQYAGERGADTELTRLLISRINFDYACNCGSVYFTDITQMELAYFSDPFFVDTLSPCGYKLFREIVYDSGCPRVCIPPEDMNYYLDQSVPIIQHFLPTGKAFVSATYKWDYSTSLCPYDELHFFKLEYANKHCIGCGSNDE